MPDATAAGAGAQPANLRGFGPPAGPRVALRTAVSEETAKKLGFGITPDGSSIGPDDFASEGSINFEVPLPQGVLGIDFQVDASVGADRDQVFRITIGDREDGTARHPHARLRGRSRKRRLPQVQGGCDGVRQPSAAKLQCEPTPADKDPAPEPFDSTYNVPEHDEFVNDVKYVRDDRFVVEYMLDDATRVRLDNAWNDLYASFEYHDNYLRFWPSISSSTSRQACRRPGQAQLDALPAEAAQVRRAPARRVRSRAGRPGGRPSAPR